MCNHVYTTKEKKKRRKSNSCFFDFLDSRTGYFLRGLPHDSKGKCLFHSRDVDWKSENNFVVNFLRTLIKLEADKSIKSIDFDEVIIADNKAKVLSIELEITKGIFLDKIEVLIPIVIKSSKFGFQFNSRSSTFFETVEIRDSEMNSVEFNRSIFKKSVTIENVNFLGGSVFFDDSIFEESIGISKSHFKGMTRFSGAKFLANGYLSRASFDRNVFHNRFMFDNCHVECSFSFNNIELRGITEFKNSSFLPVKYFSNLGSSPIVFSNIDLKKDAVLSFVGTEKENNIFQDEVYFSFDDEFEGKVDFRNTDFRFILRKSREQILKLCKIGKIEIGKGCIKYRHQTEIKSLQLRKDAHEIILDIANTFANYFVKHTGINLGVEVVDRTKESIEFYYYSDEDISEEEFLKMLGNSEENLWSSVLLNPEGEGWSLSSQRPDETKKYFDGAFSLMSIFQKVGLRMALKEWSHLDTKQLVFALEVGGKIPFTDGELHVLISKSSAVDNLKNLIGPSSYRNILKENLDSLNSKSQNNRVNILELKNLLLSNKVSECLQELVSVSNNLTPEIKKDVELFVKRFEKINSDFREKKFAQSDYERIVSTFETNLLVFLNAYDDLYNRIKEQKEGITVIPSYAEESKQVDSQSENPNLLHLTYSEVVYISTFQVKTNYVAIYTNKEKKYYKKISIAELEQQLPNFFLQVEKSHIVNMHFWKGALSFKEVFFKVPFSFKDTVPIGRGYIQSIKAYLEERF